MSGPGAAAFRGWPPEALSFYAGLEADNSKAYWEANRATFDAAVRGPMLAFTDEVGPHYGSFHIFRPHRDVRFAKDKSPYKTALGAATEGEGGEVYYLQVSAQGLFVASGYYRPARDQLDRFRAAVSDDTSGPQLVEAVAAVEGKGLEVGGEALKSAPRGYAKDHPRIRFLRHKGLTVSRAFAPAVWLATRKSLGKITATWDAAAPVNDWLNRHVGPSEEPPARAHLTSGGDNDN